MKFNKSILTFLREVAIVVIGVLIAFTINNWNENLKQKRFVKKTLFAISAEINSSKTDVAETLEKHEITIDTFYSRLENETESIKDVFEGLDGLQIPEIKNISLKYFIANNAELVDYKIISDLSEIEFNSNGLNFRIQNLMTFVYEKMESRDKLDKSKTLKLLEEVANGEDELLDIYQAFLEKYEEDL